MNPGRLVAIALGLIVGLPACGSIQEYSKLQTPVDKTLRAGPGQAIFRVQMTKDLPNIYGKADLWGRKVDAGYKELRYLGMADESTIILEFREQRVYSNETTMTRTGLAPFSATATGNTVSGVVPTGPSNTTEVLDPYGLRFTHNLAQGPVFEHSGVRVTIIKATPSELTYSLQPAHE